MGEEHRLKLSKIHIGKPKSPEQVAKQSAKLKGRKPGAEERQAYLESMERGKTTCEHCGKITTKGNYRRWHGDNCRLTGKKPI